MTLRELNTELYITATLIAAYNNPHVHFDLQNLPEEETLTKLFELENHFQSLLELKRSLAN